MPKQLTARTIHHPPCLSKQQMDNVIIRDKQRCDPIVSSWLHLEGLALKQAAMLTKMHITLNGAGIHDFSWIKTDLRLRFVVSLLLAWSYTIHHLPRGTYTVNICVVGRPECRVCRVNMLYLQNIITFAQQFGKLSNAVVCKDLQGKLKHCTSRFCLVIF